MTFRNSKLALIDTNILVYAIDKESPFHNISRTILKKVAQGSVLGCVSIQNLMEFYSVVTSKQIFKQPLTYLQAWKEILNLIQSGITVIYPEKAILNIVSELILESKLEGKRIDDLYLVATMLVNEVYTIYTANDKDFTSFTKDIQVVNPLF